MTIEPEEIQRISDSVAAAIIKKTHHIDIQDKMAISFGQPTSFAMQISDDQHKVLWKARVVHTPAINDTLIHPTENKAYRVTGVRYDFLPSELEPDCLQGHAIVLMFPK